MISSAHTQHALLDLLLTTVYASVPCQFFIFNFVWVDHHQHFITTLVYSNCSFACSLSNFLGMIRVLLTTTVVGSSTYTSRTTGKCLVGHN